MTGGAWLVQGDTRIKVSFTVHCDITLSNNIEINWEGHKWHITKPITSATCTDDPAIPQAPPVAPLDTFIGTADGELDGVGVSTLSFIFVDSGEPGGSNDAFALRITDAGGNVVLNVPLTPTSNGNVQAHYDQPHGNKP